MLKTNELKKKIRLKDPAKRINIIVQFLTDTIQKDSALAFHENIGHIIR